VGAHILTIPSGYNACMARKVLVIGGTRFFGRRIVEKLLEKGDRVTIFTRGGSRPGFWSRVRAIMGDRSDHGAFEAAFGDETFDVVIDNIAYNRKDVESAVRVFTGRAGHYVLCSSGSVYRDYEDFRQLLPRPESDADLDFKGDLDYSEGKREAEKVLVESAERAGAPSLPWTIVRPPVVQGPFDPSGRAWYWIQRVADGKEILVAETVPSTIFSLGYSGDLAEGFILAAGNPKAYSNAYNIAGAEIFSMEDYVRAVARVLGREVRTASAPLSVLRKEQGLESYEPTLVEMRFVMDITAARRDLGFTPTPAAEWLAETARWFLNDYRGDDSAGYAARDHEVEIARKVLGVTRL